MSKALCSLCFISLLALGISQEVDTSNVCSFGWYEFEGQCYKYIATAMTWADAELHCISEGANLVSIHSERQAQFVKELIKISDVAQAATWIGLSDLYKEGTWFWTDGKSMSYTLWAPGQPDNTEFGDRGTENCGGTNFGDSGLWNDFMCDNSLPFVCATRACN